MAGCCAVACGYLPLDTPTGGGKQASAGEEDAGIPSAFWSSDGTKLCARCAPAACRDASTLVSATAVMGRTHTAGPVPVTVRTSHSALPAFLPRSAGARLQPTV